MLDLSQILSYAIALGIAAAISGPGITALVSRSVANGPFVAFAMIGGLWLVALLFLQLRVSVVCCPLQTPNRGYTAAQQ